MARLSPGISNLGATPSLQTQIASTMKGARNIMRNRHRLLMEAHWTSVYESQRMLAVIRIHKRLA